MIKKIMLSIISIFTVAIASVISFACFNHQKSPIGVGHYQNSVEDTNTLHFSEGEVAIQKGSSNLNYKYEPTTNARGRTVAYEYAFHNPMPNVTQAVSLKSIDSTNVTLSYAYFNSKQTSITSSNTKFETQEVAPDGSRYIYILVTLSTAMPTDFQSKVVWNQGLLGSATIHDMDGNTYTTKIVKGQELKDYLAPSSITLNAYGAEWYSDAEYENTLTTTQGGDVYLRVPNLPTDWLEYIDSAKDRYQVKKGTSTLPKNLVVPAYYNGKPITATKSGTGPWNDNNVFFWASIDSIDFPNTLTYLGGCCLDNCRASTINLPDSLKTIDWQAFVNCENLIEIFIPKGVTYIGSSVFRNCYNLTTIVVDSDNSVYDSRDNCNAIIETASNTLWQGCKTTTIPLSVTGIQGYSPFYDIPITSIYIHENLTNIAPQAFGDTDLTEIVVSENNPVYDSRDNCNAIIETATNKLIVGCQGTVIPSSVTIIGTRAFYAQEWDDLTIPEGVQTIESFAFCWCYGLYNQTITIPSTVTYIGEHAFSGGDKPWYIKFADTTGWTVNGVSPNLSDPVTNGTYFKSTYAGYVWTKS